MKTHKCIRTPWLLLTPMLIGVCLFFVLPFGIVLYYSVTFGITGKFVWLKNYVQVMESSAFRLAMYNTLRFLLIGVPAIMLVSFVLALMLQRRLAGTKLFHSVLLLPMVMGVSSVILVIQIIFGETGLLNMLLGEHVQWMQSKAAFWILELLYIWKNFGYNVVLFLAGLNTIPRELYDCAALEGAGERQKLRFITLPLIVPTAFFVFVISVINCFRTYRENFLLAGEHPHESIYMIQHFLSNNFKNLNYQRLSVAAVSLFLLVGMAVAIFYMIQRKYEE